MTEVTEEKEWVYTKYWQRRRDWRVGRKVWCARCKRGPFGRVAGPTQGHKCASMIVWSGSRGEWYLLGCYGSTRFDCDAFRFKTAPTKKELRRRDPICDVCIQRMIDAGRLEQIDGQHPFGIEADLTEEPAV